MSEEEDAVIKEIIDRIIDVFYYSGTILEIAVAVLIFAHFVRRKNSAIASSYFYLLFWGYLFDALYELGFTCQRYLTKDWNSASVIDLAFIKYVECFIEWHIMLYMGPANVLLALNRFTSIFYITKHKNLWSKYFPLILLLLFMYPFIVNGYSFSNIHCRFDTYAPECSEYIWGDFLVRSISNSFWSVITLMVGILTTVLYRVKLKSDKQVHANQMKIEHKLLIQSVWSASFFGIYALLLVFNPITIEKKDDKAYYLFNRIFGVIIDAAYIFYHYASIILLFFFS